MLNVPLSSPPVPQVSSTGPDTGTSRTICSRSTCAAAAISSAVSPFIRSAVRTAAARASSTRPATRSRTASVTRAGGTSRRANSMAKSSENQTGGGNSKRYSKGDRRPVPANRIARERISTIFLFRCEQLLLILLYRHGRA
jgi:hypothetical protein